MSTSLGSKRSTIYSRTNYSTTLTSTTREPQAQPEIDFQNDALALEAFINNLQLQTFFQLKEEDQNDRLIRVDVLDLYRAVQNINRELAMTQLENHFLIDFLQKNDPKMLIGLEKRRVQSLQGSLSKPSGKSAATSITGSISGIRTKSIKSMMSNKDTSSVNDSAKRTTSQDYKLNFRAKAEMAEKLANEIEKRVRETERTASRQIKLLRGRMEEMRFLQIETQETIANFELHFLRDERDLAFLNNATEKQLDRKFKKFVNNWIKNARAVLATMRLRITSLHEQCQQLRNELITKADLSGILTAIDFEKLIIKRTELLNALEEKNNHMTGLKGVTGKAALSMAEEKQIMMNIEDESKQLSNKTIEVVKAIHKLEKEATIVENDNEKDMLILDNLRNQLERYEAPSINQYIEKKDEVLALEKEEKMLRRKIYILNMKLDNTQKKCKRKLESFIFINSIEQ